MRILARGEHLPVGLPRFDVILAADCVYFEPAFPLLVHTLEQLVDRQHEDQPEILFCYKKRRRVRDHGHPPRRLTLTPLVQADKRFFSMLRKSFSWSDVSAYSARHIPGADLQTFQGLRRPEQRRLFERGDIAPAIDAKINIKNARIKRSVSCRTSC